MEDPYLFTNADLFKVVDNAKQNMLNLSLPLYISNKEVEQRSIISLAVIESVLSLLNSKNLLTKAVQVDYTDMTCNYEINEE